MLKLFRHKYWKQLLLLPIVGTLALAMLAYLVPGATDVSLRDPQGIVARVGPSALTQAEVNQQYQRVAEQFGGQASALRSFIMQQLIDDLVTQRAVEYEAGRLGLEVTPEEVRARLQQISLLYPGGQFVGQEIYRQLVEQQFKMTVPQFEETLRQQALAAKVFDWVTAGMSVTPAEIEQEFRRRNERVKVEFVVFSPAELARGLQSTEADLQAYFDKNHDRYRLPARRAVRYVAVDFDTMGRRVRVSRPELEAYYQRNHAAYESPERVQARHILFLLRPPSQTEAAPGPAAVRKKAEDVLAQLRRGKDFAALAKQYSDDAATKEKGGELGWVRRGQTAPALEQALFSLAPGAPAQLVETGYGFHLMQVTAHEPERVKPLAEVQGEIEAVLQQDKVHDAALAEARQLVATVRGGKTLEQAARQAGWPVMETGLFERESKLGPFGESREFQDAAFALPAETAGQPTAPVSEPVAVPPGYAVLQLKEDAPARPAQFAEVRGQVLNAYQRERGEELARDAARRLAEEAGKAGDLRAPAARQKLAVKISDLFGRDGFVKELGAARDLAPVAFSLPVGGVSPALPVNNNWVVFRVLARVEADLAKFSEQDRTALRNSLLEQKRNLAWAVFTQALRKRLQAEGKLKLNQAAIERLVGKS